MHIVRICTGAVHAITLVVASGAWVITLVYTSIASAGLTLTLKCSDLTEATLAGASISLVATLVIVLLIVLVSSAAHLWQDCVLVKHLAF